jgi:hypothetical protein
MLPFLTSLSAWRMILTGVGPCDKEFLFISEYVFVHVCLCAFIRICVNLMYVCIDVGVYYVELKT